MTFPKRIIYVSCFFKCLQDKGWATCLSELKRCQFAWENLLLWSLRSLADVWIPSHLPVVSKSSATHGAQCTLKMKKRMHRQLLLCGWTATLWVFPVWPCIEGRTVTLRTCCSVPLKSSASLEKASPTFPPNPRVHSKSLSCPHSALWNCYSVFFQHQIERSRLRRRQRWRPTQLFLPNTDDTW